MSQTNARSSASATAAARSEPARRSHAWTDQVGTKEVGEFGGAGPLAHVAHGAGHTWDSARNKYHGADAFAFSCELTRVFVRAEKPPAFAEADADVTAVRLVGDKLATGAAERGHFLSDHFGLSFDVRLYGGEKPEVIAIE